MLREALETSIVSGGQTFILVLHSYGGVAGIKAVPGLGAAARQKEGGIIHCIFVAAFLVPIESSLIGMSLEATPYLLSDVGLSI